MAGIRLHGSKRKKGRRYNVLEKGGIEKLRLKVTHFFKGTKGHKVEGKSPKAYKHFQSDPL